MRCCACAVVLGFVVLSACRSAAPPPPARAVATADEGCTEVVVARLLAALEIEASGEAAVIGCLRGRFAGADGWLLDVRASAGRITAAVTDDGEILVAREDVYPDAHDGAIAWALHDLDGDGNHEAIEVEDRDGRRMVYVHDGAVLDHVGSLMLADPWQPGCQATLAFAAAGAGEAMVVTGAAGCTGADFVPGAIRYRIIDDMLTPLDDVHAHDAARGCDATVIDRLRVAVDEEPGWRHVALACARGRDGWLLDVQQPRRGDFAHRFIVLLRDDGVLLHFEYEGDNEAVDDARGTTHHWEMRDLDGDGEDEAISVESRAGERTTQVWRRDGDVMTLHAP
jgi:hypothetical protein